MAALEIVRLTITEQEVRCPKCHKILFRGALIGSVQCQNCKVLVVVRQTC